VTRAKKCLVILGSSKTVEEMIENDKENLRYSGLGERITEIFAT
jgi:exodeoxyribonuclease V alpha subunit